MFLFYQIMLTVATCPVYSYVVSVNIGKFELRVALTREKVDGKSGHEPFVQAGATGGTMGCNCDWFRHTSDKRTGRIWLPPYRTTAQCTSPCTPTRKMAGSFSPTFNTTAFRPIPRSVSRRAHKRGVVRFWP